MSQTRRLRPAFGSSGLSPPSSFFGSSPSSFFAFEYFRRSLSPCRISTRIVSFPFSPGLTSSLSQYQTTTPPGAFWPAAFGGGSSPSSVQIRIRSVGRGGKRRAASAAISGFQRRSGVTSSRIQNALPCVATTRSPRLTWRSVIGTGGRFRWNGCQLPPSSNERKSPRSVPAKRSPLRPGSSRTTRTNTSSGSPVTTFAHVFP